MSQNRTFTPTAVHEHCRYGMLTRFADTDPCWSGLQYTPSMIDSVMSSESYDDLCQPYDFSDFESDHGGPHMWLSGHLTSLPCARPILLVSPLLHRYAR